MLHNNFAAKICLVTMTFLSSSILGRSTRQSIFHPSWLNTRRVRCISRTTEAYTEFLAKQKADTVPTTKSRLSFESLGIGVPFIQALQRAFPKVKTPTDLQTQLIPAILGTQDILLKDVTGSGKCVVVFLSQNFFFCFGYLFLVISG